MIDVRQIHRIVGGAISGASVHYPTPGHSAKDRGMCATVDPSAPGGFLVHSFNGGDALAEKARIEAALGIEAPARRDGWRETGCFTYRDMDGAIAYRTVRLEKPGERKRFLAQRPDGAGGWINKLGDVPRVPYRLPELLAADPAAPVLLLEGERKADKAASMGFIATAIAFGAKGWRADYAEHLRGRNVIILPDADGPGRQFAEQVRRAIGATARILELPGLPPGGDLIDWAGTADELRRLIDKALDDTPGSRPAYLSGISAAALMAKQFQPVRYIINDLLAEGATLFAGKPKLGKSWLALDIGLAVASGHPLFGSLPVEGGDVLYLALEDSERRLRSRLVKKGMSVPERLTLATEWPDMENGCIAELDAWADAMTKPVLVIIDVLKKVRSATRYNEAIYDADYRALDPIAKWARGRGLAALIVHHVRKMDADDPLDCVSGTTGLTGASDTVMVLKRDTGTGHCILYVRGRDVEEAEKAVRFEPDTGRWRLLGNADEVGRSNERQAILDLLREKAIPLTVREISDILGKNYEAVRKCLTRMFGDGDIQKMGRGTYACPECPNVRNEDNRTDRTDRTGLCREDVEPGFEAPDDGAAFLASIPRAAWLADTDSKAPF